MNERLYSRRIFAFFRFLDNRKRPRLIGAAAAFIRRLPYPEERRAEGPGLLCGKAV